METSFLITQSMTMTFQTSDFMTAATLVALKYRLLKIDRTNPRRSIFEFEQTAKLQDDIQLLQSGDLLLNPVDFWAAERRCKQLIYEGERL